MACRRSFAASLFSPRCPFSCFSASCTTASRLDLVTSAAIPVILGCNGDVAANVSAFANASSRSPDERERNPEIAAVAGPQILARAVRRSPRPTRLAI